MKKTMITAALGALVLAARRHAVQVRGVDADVDNGDAHVPAIGALTVER